MAGARARQTRGRALARARRPTRTNALRAHPRPSSSRPGRRRPRSPARRRPRSCSQAPRSADGPVVVLDFEGHRKGGGGSRGARIRRPRGHARCARRRRRSALSRTPPWPRWRCGGWHSSASGSSRAIACSRSRRTPCTSSALRRLAPVLETRAVVHASPHTPVDGIVSELRARSIPVRAVGDARAPRLVEDAIPTVMRPRWRSDAHVAQRVGAALRTACTRNGRLRVLPRHAACPRVAASRARRASRLDPDARRRAPRRRGSGCRRTPSERPVPAILEYIPYRKGDARCRARRAAPPLLRGSRLRLRARRSARQRRLRGHPAATSTCRRSRTTPRRCSPGSREQPWCTGARRHDRDLLGRLQRAAGRGAAAAAARRRDQPLLDRRPLRRRRPLHGRLRARRGHAARGRRRCSPTTRARRTRRSSATRLARDVARAAASETPPLRRGLARPPAPRRVLEARLGLRGLRGDRRARSTWSAAGPTATRNAIPRFLAGLRRRRARG